MIHKEVVSWKKEERQCEETLFFGPLESHRCKFGFSVKTYIVSANFSIISGFIQIDRCKDEWSLMVPLSLIATFIFSIRLLEYINRFKPYRSRDAPPV